MAAGLTTEEPDSLAPLRVQINGLAEASIPLMDRGLHYGHGVFESLRVVRGRPTLWKYHCDRMFEGCRRLGIVLTPRRVDEAVQQFLQHDDTAVLKVIVTAGSASRGYRFDDPVLARLVLLLFPPATTCPNEGITVRLCATRLAEQPALAGIKHLNRLEQVIARREWFEPSITEGLMRDQSGRLIEGIQSNLFIVRDHQILTPVLQNAGVAGVMRRFLLEHKPGCATVPIREGDLLLGDLEAAQECFLTNSVVGVMPVTQILGGASAWRRPVGKITRRIVDAIDDEFKIRDQN